MPDESAQPAPERDRPRETNAPTLAPVPAPVPTEAAPAPVEAAPAPARTGPLEVKIAGSLVRCPFCHGDISPRTTDWVACSACLARHHKDCWQERGACSTCRGSNYLPADGARFFREGVGSAPVMQK